MEELFLSVLRTSLTASYVILVVMLARFPLKKAPKVISYALWSVTAFRLLCPFSFESVISLLPVHSESIPQNIVFQQQPSSGSIAATGSQQISNPLPSSALPQAMSGNSMQILLHICTSVWLLGLFAMLAYSIISVIILNRRLTCAQNLHQNIYLADNLKTPFVLGIFKPKIYIPIGLSVEEQVYIVLHEQTHIRRFDHAVKPFAFLILSIHWFNPLVWVAFRLMSTDMELSCDEKVVKEMGNGIKRAYSESLLSLATGKHILNGTPLAFGEGNIRSRIQNVLRYKKPKFWVIAVAVVGALCVGIGLIANPQKAVTNNVQVSNTKNQSQPANLSDFVIADNETTLSNGKQVNVRLVMTDGKYYKQSQIPYGGNTYDNNYQGSYEIQVIDTTGKLLSKMNFYTTWYYTDSSKDVNFPGKFNLLFDDYNRDGNPDFTVGQWFSGSAKQYQIFTVMPDGSVKGISKGDVVQDCDISDVKNCSVKFEKDNESGFYASVYVNGNVSGNRRQKAHYSWDINKKCFIADGSSAIKG